MNPIQVPAEARHLRPTSALVMMGPPAGVSEEQCGTVEMLVSRDQIPGVGRGHYAYFRPTPEELAVLSDGGFIEVAQYGHVVQPFAAVVWGRADALYSRAQELVSQERARQISVEGYTQEHDRQHPSTELLAAAHAYAITTSDGDTSIGLVYWPWEPALFKPWDRRSNLVRAGALYVAELELARLTPADDVKAQEALERVLQQLAAVLGSESAETNP